MAGLGSDDKVWISEDARDDVEFRVHWTVAVSGVFDVETDMEETSWLSDSVGFAFNGSWMGGTKPFIAFLPFLRTFVFSLFLTFLGCFVLGVFAFFLWDPDSVLESALICRTFRFDDDPSVPSPG